MAHCQRCRADAVGLLGDAHSQQAIDRLMAAKAPAKDRPNIAVVSQEGFLVNQHLGGADEILIYENTNIDGHITPHLVDRRRTLPPAAELTLGHARRNPVRLQSTHLQPGR